MDEAIFMNHLDDHLRECFADESHVDFSLLHLVYFIHMTAVDVLHYQQLLGRFPQQFGNVDIAKLLSLEHFAYPIHVGWLLLKIQLFLDIDLELLKQPLKLEAREHILGCSHEYPHQLDIVVHVLWKVLVLHLHCYFLSCYQTGTVHLPDRRWWDWCLVELWESLCQFLTRLLLNDYFHVLESADFAAAGQSHHWIPILIRNYHIQGSDKLTQLNINATVFA